eukprot:c19826_g1_i1.p1 GENE.c19826_g1_i1~~c19826_g1_i1.p1  ORF type:complete len:257 (-),score=36.05 c19826_g1_i1:49-819(-)
MDSYDQQRSALLILNPLSYILSTIAQNNDKFAWKETSIRDHRITKGELSVSFVDTEYRVLSFESLVRKLFSLSNYCGNESFIYALCLLKQLESKPEAFTIIKSSTVYNMFFTCWMLACKFLEDEVLDNKAFVILGGTNSKQLRDMELHYFFHLGLNVSIPPDDLYIMSQRIALIYHTQDRPKPEFDMSNCTRLSDLFPNTEGRVLPTPMLSTLPSAYTFIYSHQKKSLFSKVRSILRKNSDTPKQSLDDLTRSSHF